MRQSVWKRWGPGWLVTAAFIGPGTVMTASLAGAQFGGQLLWVVGVAVVAAIVLQEMAARFGLVTRGDLARSFVETWTAPWVRGLALSLVLGAILVGNAAYQAGNLTGASVGLQGLVGGSRSLWVAAVAAVATVALLTGGFVWLQRLLIGLVLAMSAVFLAAAVFLLPRWTALPLSHFQPDLPQGGWWTAVALLGTTVVPYNLFLHARSVQERWDGERDVTVSLRESRWDTGWAIVLGGVVTAAILLTAVVAFHVPGVRLEELSQVVAQLEPVAGAQGCYLFAAGLFGAGLTSAITAPLAAAWVAAGCLGWNSGWTDWRFRGVGVGVVWIGAAAAILGGGSPRAVILFAQGANGLLLPVIGIFLLVTMNRHSLLGSHRNGFWANFLGVGVLVIALILGWRPWAQWF